MGNALIVLAIIVGIVGVYMYKKNSPPAVDEIEERKKREVAEFGVSEQDILKIGDVHSRHFHALNLVKWPPSSTAHKGLYASNYADADITILFEIGYGTGERYPPFKKLVYPFIAITKDMNQMVLCPGGEIDSPQGKIFTFPTDSIVSCEIIINKKSVVETNKKNAISRAIVGGVLAGGVGAIVGAASSSSVSNTTETIKEISIKIGTNDFRNPFFIVQLFDPTSVGNETYTAKRLDVANKWHARVAAIIKNNANTENKSSKETLHNP